MPGMGIGLGLSSRRIAKKQTPNVAPTVYIDDIVQPGRILNAYVSDGNGIATINSYQWERSNNPPNWTTVSSASTYTVSPDDIGYVFRVQVSVTDSLGNTATAISGSEGPASAPAHNPTATVTGTATVGNTLTASIQDSLGVNAATVVRKWQKTTGTTWIDIPGTDSYSFLITSDLIGFRVRFFVSYSDNGGTPRALASAPSNVIS